MSKLNNNGNTKDSSFEQDKKVNDKDKCDPTKINENCNGVVDSGEQPGDCLRVCMERLHCNNDPSGATDEQISQYAAHPEDAGDHNIVFEKIYGADGKSFYSAVYNPELRFRCMHHTSTAFTPNDDANNLHYHNHQGFNCRGRFPVLRMPWGIPNDRIRETEQHNEALRGETPFNPIVGSGHLPGVVHSDNAYTRPSPNANLFSGDLRFAKPSYGYDHMRQMEQPYALRANTACNPVAACNYNLDDYAYFYAQQQWMRMREIEWQNAVNRGEADTYPRSEEGFASHTHSDSGSNYYPANNPINGMNFQNSHKNWTTNVARISPIESHNKFLQGEVDNNVPGEVQVPTRTPRNLNTEGNSDHSNVLLPNNFPQAPTPPNNWATNMQRMRPNGHHNEVRVEEALLGKDDKPSSSETGLPTAHPDFRYPLEYLHEVEKTVTLRKTVNYKPEEQKNQDTKCDTSNNCEMRRHKNRYFTNFQSRDTEQHVQATDRPPYSCRPGYTFNRKTVDSPRSAREATDSNWRKHDPKSEVDNWRTPRSQNDANDPTSSATAKTDNTNWRDRPQNDGSKPGSESVEKPKQGQNKNNNTIGRDNIPSTFFKNWRKQQGKVKAA